MNRRRTEQRCGPLPVAVLVAAAALGAFGGIVHVYYKNRQIEVARHIERAEERIAQHRNDIRTVQMRMDQMLNRYVMRAQLRELGSELRPIPAEKFEVIAPGDLSAAGDEAVASNRP